MTEVFISILFFLAALLFVVIIGYNRPKLFAILLIAFALRTSLALVHAFVVPLPDSQADAVMYQRIAEEWSSGGFSSVLNHFTTGAFLYSWVLAVIYSLTEPIQLAGQGLNVLLGVASVYVVWLIGMEISNGNEQIARRSAWIAAFFPTLNLYSAITMRESFITFFFLGGTFYFIRWSKNKSPVQFAKGTAGYVISGLFHSGMFVALTIPGIFLLSTQVYQFMKKKGTLSLKLLRSSFLLLIAISIILITGWGMEKIGIARNISSFQEYTSSARAGYLQDLIVRSPFDLIWQSPIRLFYFLFAPFPWMVRSVADLFGTVDSLLYFMMAYLIIKNLSSVNSLTLKLSLSVVIVGLMVFAIATSNYGQAIRHRAKFAPVLIPIAVTVSESTRVHIKKRLRKEIDVSAT
jgi:hypothetical protein